MSIYKVALFATGVVVNLAVIGGVDALYRRKERKMRLKINQRIAKAQPSVIEANAAKLGLAPVAPAAPIAQAA